MNQREVEGAIWLNLDGQGVKCHLWMKILCSIKETGSISGTALEIGTSYSKVYNEIVKLNCAAGKKLIVSARGGVGGGFAELTDEGHQLVKIFEEAQKQFKLFVEELNCKLEPFF